MQLTRGGVYPSNSLVIMPWKKSWWIICWIVGCLSLHKTNFNIWRKEMKQNQIKNANIGIFLLMCLYSTRSSYTRKRSILFGLQTNIENRQLTSCRSRFVTSPHSSGVGGYFPTSLPVDISNKTWPKRYYCHLYKHMRTNLSGVLSLRSSRESWWCH